MVSEKILVGSALGIHLRPAGAMCDAAVKFDSHITFTYKNKVVNAKSVTGRIFTKEESADHHCQIGNLMLVLRTMEDWQRSIKE